MIVFRADGNPQIGSGHVMRCLSIAEALRERGEECRFVTADTEMHGAIRRAGFEATALDTAFDRMDEELPLLTRELKSLAAGVVVIDSYYVTEPYLRALGGAAKTVYVDDLSAMPYPVDCVLNYNLYATEEAYRKLYGAAGKRLPRLLLGTRYAPLRKEFRGRARKEQKQTVSDVLVLTGGADLEHVALTYLRHLRGEAWARELRWHFVVGALNPDAEALGALAAEMPHVELCRNVLEMYPLMARCDVAISAAGSTLYELCASGVPTICYVLADNQSANAAAFAGFGAALCAGDVRRGTDYPGTFDALLRALRGDRGKRDALTRGAYELVDGDGARRVAEAITEWEQTLVKA